MAWKRRSTSTTVRAEVDLDEFGRAELLQALIDDRAITEAEAEAILGRPDLTSSPIRARGSSGNDLELAGSALHRGDREDALIHVERHLGRDWIGRLTR